MPSANGVYTLPPGYLAVTGQPILASQHNPPLEDIAAALTLRLSRDGTAPMTGPLQLAGGAVGAPGVVFSTDGTTGFYKTANGIGVSVLGTQVAEFTAGGVMNGARFIGELIPYSGATAPALTVLPFGQTLSRTAYPALWTFAQTQIAAGNTLYNNGDGSTTFGVPDLRGRVASGIDAMGGTAAGRLSGFGLGAAGGVQTVALATSNLPPYTPSGSLTLGTAAGFALVQAPTSGSVNIGGGGSGGTLSGGGGGVITGSFAGNAQGGSSAPITNVQPTIATNYLLFAGA